MAETLHIHLPDFSGETTLVQFLYDDDGILLNAGGDVLVESPVASGRFQTLLDEARAGLGTLASRIYDGAETPDNLIWDGWLAEDMTLIIADYPVSSGSNLDELVPELVATPAATSSLKDKITFMFMYYRNKLTQDDNFRKLHADNGTTVVAQEAVSDTGVLYTKGEAT